MLKSSSATRDVIYFSYNFLKFVLTNYTGKWRGLKMIHFYYYLMYVLTMEINLQEFIFLLLSDCHRQLTSNEYLFWWRWWCTRFTLERYLCWRKTKKEGNVSQIMHAHIFEILHIFNATSKCNYKFNFWMLIEWYSKTLGFS